jgi:hypothetical protein
MSPGMGHPGLMENIWAQDGRRMVAAPFQGRAIDFRAILG